MAPEDHKVSMLGFFKHALRSRDTQRTEDLHITVQMDFVSLLCCLVSSDHESSLCFLLHPTPEFISAEAAGTAAFVCKELMASVDFFLFQE